MNKEVIYQWTTLVKAGTLLPAPYASQFLMHGKVHVQPTGNSTFVKITDLTYKLYNGILDQHKEHEAHPVPVPAEISDLGLPFRVVYDENDLVLGIATNSKEKDFTRNMKKAMASILQVDVSAIKDVDYPHGFIGNEHSIFGYGQVDYNIMPHGDRIEIRKMHDMHDSSHLYQEKHSNTEHTHCDLPKEEPIMHDSHRAYSIVKKDGHNIIQRIQANGAIVYYPHKALSDSQYIYVNQTFELVDVVPIKQQMQVESEKFEHSLTYHYFDNTEVEHIPDLTNGRHMVDFSKIFPEVQQMLGEAWEYLQQDHIHTGHPDTKKGQLINRIVRLLAKFDMSKLEELEMALKSNVHSLEMFYNIVPLVGTKASSLLIKKLVVSKTVSDDLAMEMLQHMPENILVPSVSLVKDMEELMHLGDNIHWNVKKVAIMTFGTLVHKSWHYVVRHEHENMHHMHMETTDHHHHHEEHHEEHNNKHEQTIEQLQQPYEKYVAEYLKQVKENQDFKMKMPYMLGLLNMKLRTIVQHLTPMLQGKVHEHHNVRIWALWAISNAIEHSHEHDKLMEVIWPVFTNHHEYLEMRMSAYLIIMRSNPSPSMLMNIYWTMLNEPNQEMYHLHYTYVNSMMKSVEPCHQIQKVRLAQIMKFMGPPSHGLSTAHMSEYQDVDFGFSGSIETYLINSNDSQILTLSMTSQKHHYLNDDYTFVVKIHGSEHKFKNAAHLVEFAQHTVGKGEVKSDFHLEITIIRHKHAINTYYFTKENMNELILLTDFFVKNQQSVTKKMLHIHYHRRHVMLIPTELGIPAIWQYQMPVVNKGDISVSKEVVNNVLNIHVDNKYVQWAHYRHGLVFYNPIVDVYQGINRFHAYDAVLPMHLEFSLNAQQKSLQVSWRKHKDPKDDLQGMRSHVMQMTYVQDDNQKNLLEQFTPKTPNYDIVTLGHKYDHDVRLVLLNSIYFNSFFSVHHYGSP